MNGLDFIKSKQQSWAKRKNFNLLGGTIPNKGEKNYLYSLADNLFEPLSKENLDSYLKSASNLNGNLNCSKELEHYAS